MKDIKEVLMELIENAKVATEEETAILVEAFLLRLESVDIVDSLLTERQVADLYPALTPGKLKTFRSKGGGPPYIKTGQSKTSRIFYLVSSIRKWVKSFPEQS